MTNVEVRRNDKIRIIRSGRRLRFRHSGFDIPSSFVIRASSFRNSAVTIIELLVVIIIILILAGLILSISSYVQNKGARARAETEIAAMSAALESYKADNGLYPRGNASDGITAVSDQTFASKVPPDPKPLPGYNSDPRPSNPDATTYNNASFVLYAQLSGNLNGDRSTIAQRSYFQFKPNMLYPKGGSGVVTAVIDPFGNK